MTDTTKTPAPVPASAPGSDTAAVPAVLPASVPVTDEITARLTELGVDANLIGKIKDLGVETVDDLQELDVPTLTGIGMKPIPAKKIVAALKKPTAAPAPSAPPAPGAYGVMALDSVLPAVPTEDSWLSMLKAGGVLKADPSTVIAAVRAALAQRVGLFDILDKVVAKMEEFADANEEAVDAEFFKLKKQMTRRNYGEIFESLEGFDGTYVTEGRKKKLFARIDSILWPAISGFYDQLKSWQEAWMQGAANPALMMGAIMAATTGGGSPIPPGMMSPPETGALRDYADAVNDACNKVFAGTGVQIASAIAFDASKIKIMLANPRLPTLMGFASHDQMLRQMNLSVPATYPRLETNLTRFVLSTLQVKNVPSGNEETAFFGSMYMLGSQIPWDQLGVGGTSRKPTGLGETGDARRGNRY